MATGEEIAAGITAALDELASVVRGCDDTTWASTTEEEGWSVAAVAHHAATGHALFAGWIAEALATGAIATSRSAIDERNVAAAEVSVSATREQVLTEVTAHSALVARVASLDAAELARITAFGPAEGRAMPLALICGIPERHLRSHTASIRATAGA